MVGVRVEVRVNADVGKGVFMVNNDADEGKEEVCGVGFASPTASSTVEVASGVTHTRRHSRGSSSRVP